MYVISSENKEENIKSGQREKKTRKKIMFGFFVVYLKNEEEKTSHRNVKKRKKKKILGERTHTWIFGFRRCIFYAYGFIVQIKNNHLLLFISVIWIGVPHWWTKWIKPYFGVNLLVVYLYLSFSLSISSFSLVFSHSFVHSFAHLLHCVVISVYMQFYLINIE